MEAANATKARCVCNKTSAPSDRCSPVPRQASNLGGSRQECSSPI